MLGVGALAGCTADVYPIAPDESPSPIPSPSPVDPDAATATLVAGAVEFAIIAPMEQEASAATFNLSAEVEGAVTLSIEAAQVAPGEPIMFILVSPGILTATNDGGLVVTDATGAVVGAIAPPHWRATLTLTADTEARLALPLNTSTTPDVFTVSLGTQGIRSAHWVERSDGPSLFTDPTNFARTSSMPGWMLAWSEVIRYHPEADAPGLLDQIICHGIGAADKETWNLEPWRPDVGLAATLAARCNP